MVPYNTIIEIILYNIYIYIMIIGDSMLYNYNFPGFPQPCPLQADLDFLSMNIYELSKFSHPT